MSTPTESEMMSAASQSAVLGVKLQMLKARAEAEIREIQNQMDIVAAVRDKTNTEEQLAAYRAMESGPPRAVPAPPATAPDEQRRDESPHSTAPQPVPVYAAQQANLASPEVAAPAQIAQAAVVKDVGKEKDDEKKFQDQKKAWKELKADFIKEWEKVQHDADHFVALVIHLTTTRAALLREACDSPHDMWQTLTKARAANDTLTKTILNSRMETAWSDDILADVTSALRAYYSTKPHDGVIYKTTHGCRDEVSRQTWEIFRRVMTDIPASPKTYKDYETVLTARTTLYRLQAGLAGNQTWLVSNIDSAVLAIAGLPETSYQTWKRGLRATKSVDELTSYIENTIVQDILLSAVHEELPSASISVAATSAPHDPPQEAAIAATTSTSQDGRRHERRDGPRDTRAIQCYKCMGIGHYQKDCRKSDEDVLAQLERRAEAIKNKTHKAGSSSTTKPSTYKPYPQPLPALKPAVRFQQDGKPPKIKICRLDSGAEASMMSAETAEELNLDVAEVRAPVAVRGAAADGPPFHIVGMTNDCAIDIGGMRCTIDFFVVRERLPETLIGLPELCQLARTNDVHTISWRAEHGRWKARLGPGAWIDAGPAERASAAAVGVTSVSEVLQQEAPRIMESKRALIDLIEQAHKRDKSDEKDNLCPPIDDGDEPAIDYHGPEETEYRRRHDADNMRRNVVELARANIEGTPDDINRTMALLREFAPSFGDGSALPPIANVGRHFVRLPWRRDPEPTDFAPLRHHRPRQEMEFLEKKCEQLISSGRAEECYVAHGPIAESLGMKKTKDDGTIRWRLVHNMRVFERVHATTQAQIPNLHEMMEKLTRFKIFSELDAVSYYDHFPLGKRDAKRTVMRVGNKLLQYLVTPQGASAAATHVAGFTAARLTRMGDDWCVFAYFDNFLVGSMDNAGHDEALRWLLERASRDNLSITFNVLKCKFRRTLISSLGKQFAEMLMSPTKEWIREIEALPKPATRAQARSMLGLVAFNSEFVAVEAADHVRSISKEAMRDNGKGAMEWTTELDAAWLLLKKAAANPAVLSTFDPRKEACVITDAARTHRDGGAAFLCQFDDRDKSVRICRVFTHTWTDAEQNYSAADAELQVFRVACKRWRFYLLDREFKWFTDSESMAKRLKSLHLEGNMRIVNTVLDLQEFRFEAVYAKGAWLAAVDYWSRGAVRRRRQCSRRCR
jgi:hypothetical protein